MDVVSTKLAKQEETPLRAVQRLVCGCGAFAFGLCDGLFNQHAVYKGAEVLRIQGTGSAGGIRVTLTDRLHDGAHLANGLRHPVGLAQGRRPALAEACVEPLQGGLQNLAVRTRNKSVVIVVFGSAYGQRIACTKGALKGQQRCLERVDFRFQAVLRKVACTQALDQDAKVTQGLEY